MGQLRPIPTETSPTLLCCPIDGRPSMGQLRPTPTETSPTLLCCPIDGLLGHRWDSYDLFFLCYRCLHLYNCTITFECLNNNNNNNNILRSTRCAPRFVDNNKDTKKPIQKRIRFRPPRSPYLFKLTYIECNRYCPKWWTFFHILI